MTVDQLREVLALLGFKTLKFQSGNFVIPCPFAAVSAAHKSSVDRHPSMNLLATESEAGAIFRCFTCKNKGTIKWFVERLKGLGYETGPTEKLLDAILVVDVEDVVEQIPEYDEHALPDPARQYPVFPEKWLDPMKGSVPRYILLRGVHLETCKRWHLGHDREEMRVVFPVRDRLQRLVGVIGGLTKQVPFVPKYKNYWARLHAKCGRPLAQVDGDYTCAYCDNQRVRAPNIKKGFQTSHFLFGEHMVKDQAEFLVVVEGMVDVLKVSQELPPNYAPLGLIGSQIHPQQVATLSHFARGRKAVILMLDNDSAGWAATYEVNRAIGRRTRVLFASYDGVSEGADPGSMTKQELICAVQRAAIIFE